MPALRLDQLSFLGRGPIDLTIEPGECVALAGPSGSGKTLMLRAIADLDPHEGRVWLGEDEAQQLPAPLWRHRVGLLPAESQWWEDRVGDHFPPASGDPATTAQPAACQSWLDELGFSGGGGDGVADEGAGGGAGGGAAGSAGEGAAVGAAGSAAEGAAGTARGGAMGVMDWDVGRLSTGEKQRLALVRLLCNRPHALLLDEPTASLDPENVGRVERLITELRRSAQIPILWVTHDPAQMPRIADRGYRLDHRGRLAAQVHP